MMGIDAFLKKAVFQYGEEGIRDRERERDREYSIFSNTHQEYSIFSNTYPHEKARQIE